MLETPVLDRPLTGTERAGPEPPGTGRVEQLVEGFGIVIFAVLVVSALVVLIRIRRRVGERH